MTSHQILPTYVKDSIRFYYAPDINAVEFDDGIPGSKSCPVGWASCQNGFYPNWAVAMKYESKTSIDSFYGKDSAK